jgi:hypothetical protein
MRKAKKSKDNPQPVPAHPTDVIEQQTMRAAVERHGIALNLVLVAWRVND